MTTKKQIMQYQAGFSLLELAIVLLIVSIIAGFTTQAVLTKNLIQQIDDNANKAFSQVTNIFEAAGQFRLVQGKWPREFSRSGPCYMSILQLNGMSGASPIIYLRDGSVQSPYFTNYTTTCDDYNFIVNIDTTDPDTALVLANKFANSTVTASVVSTSVPASSINPTLSDFLRLDGTRAMLGNLDLGGNAINNVSDVSANDGRGLVDVFTIVPLPTAIVSKPNCPVGKSANINLALVGIVLANNKLPFSHPPFVSHQTPTAWTVRLNVFDEDGATTAASGTFVQVTTSCK